MHSKRKLTITALKLLSASLFLLTLIALEPLAGRKEAHAVMYSIDPSESYSQLLTAKPEQHLTDQPVKQPIGNKTRAPEPGTFLTILAGIASYVVRLIRRSFERFKRIFDIVFSMVGLIASLPILLIAAVAIKLTAPGPIFYRQKRVGKDGRVFEIYKLRSMRIDAEKNSGAVWAQARDPRVTPIGRILRKTHFDEIPQFFNVIKGDMSIIGPRPERPELVKDFKKLIAGYENRLAVKPGITGLAQVFHRYDETIDDVRKKIHFDVRYISNRCLKLDIEILARTCVSVTTGRGAR